MDRRPQHVAMTQVGVPSDPNMRGEYVTYYRVDFMAAKLISRPAKRFVTEEKAKQHARRVLGVADNRGLVSRVTIVAVTKEGLVI